MLPSVIGGLAGCFCLARKEKTATAAVFLNLTWFVLLGERNPASLLPESKAQANKAEQHHSPSRRLGNAGD